MRIGIDCRIYGSAHGYMGMYTESLISYLAKNEDTHEYVLFCNDSEADEFIKISYPFRVIKTTARVGSFKEQTILPYQLYKEKLDLVFFPQPNIPLGYWQKSIVVLSDLVPYFYPDRYKKGSWMRYLYVSMLRMSMRKASTIIAFSEVLKHDIIEIFDTSEEKIQVISPLHLQMQIGSEHELQQFFIKENFSKKYILSVGNLREYKNISRLLQAYSILIQEKSIDVDLVLVGKEDPSYHEIRSTLIQLGLQNRVHIYNILEEKEIGFLYKNASLYISPSLYEGSEQVLLTAIFYNLPIVASLLPGMTTVIGRSGVIFFRPTSIPDMGNAIKKALEDTSVHSKKDQISGVETDHFFQKILTIFTLHENKITVQKIPNMEEKNNL